MDLSNLISGVSSGSAIVNPLSSASSLVTSATSSLSGVAGTYPSVGTLATSINTSLSTMQANINALNARLPTLLPLASAGDRIEKQIQSMAGTVPANKAGSNFSNVFAPLTAAKAQLESFQTTLAGSQSKLLTGDSAEITKIQNSMTSMNNTVNTSFSTSTSSLTSQISTIKSYAFAKFLSSPQPAHVEQIKSIVTTGLPSTGIAKLDSDMAAKTLKDTSSPVAAVMGDKMSNYPTNMKGVSAAPLPAPAPVAPANDTAITGPIGRFADYPSYKADMVTYMNMVFAKKDALLDARTAAIDTYYAKLKATWPNYFDKTQTEKDALQPTINTWAEFQAGETACANYTTISNYKATVVSTYSAWKAGNYASVPVTTAGKPVWDDVVPYPTAQLGAAPWA